MCRFTLYLGSPVRMSTLLTEPQHSLIKQSYESNERSEPLNGDGFGVGWYAPRLHSQPAQFHETTPAWNNQNLESIARVVASPCIMAHVRAASLGSLVNLSNCHPFGFGDYLLMHNGEVGNFHKIRRQLMETLTDDAFNVVRGSTDTEHLFAMFVDELIRNQKSLNPGKNGHEGWDGLQLAEHLSRALQRILQIIQGRDDWEPSYLNVAVADGSHVAVCRFTDASDDEPESLHLLHGELYEPISKHFKDASLDEGESMIVSSEPLNQDGRWKDVSRNCMLVLDRKRVPLEIPMNVDGSLVH
jgi:glutamine amidotransferase